MKIEKDLVVSIHFGVSDEDGKVIDSTENDAPLEYIHGSDYLVPGLETILDGKSVGDKFDVTVGPEQAYGEYQDDLVQEVPTELFGEEADIDVGMRFVAETDQGQRSVEITKVAESTVTVDANHPLAGLTLQFVGEVVSMREATEEELAHGHPHGEGGCGHDHSHDENGCCGGADHEESCSTKH